MKYLLIILSLLIIFSCRTKRNVQKSETKTDSTKVVIIDSGSVQKKKAVLIKGRKVTVRKKEKKDRTVTTIIEDFKVPDTIKEPKIIRRTTIKEKRRDIINTEENKTDTTKAEIDTSDSTFNNKSDSTHLKSEDKGKSIDVEKKTIGWVNAWLLLLFLAIIIISWYYIEKNWGKIKNWIARL